jgi:hypothetical protein
LKPAQLLARAARVSCSQQARHVARIALIVLGLLVQIVLLALVANLVDLSIALMEVWAELARKHLELTL